MFDLFSSLCADKEQDGAGDLRVLPLLEVHKVLQDLEGEGEGPTQAHGLPQRCYLP